MAEYRVHDPEKGLIGPISLATLKDLVTAGVVHDGFWISRDGGPFLPVRAFAEITPPPALDSSQEPRPTYSGDLGKNTFFKVFYRFHLTHATGRLVVERGEQFKEVYLQQGQPVVVNSNSESERLGNFLVVTRRLDQHELAVALNSMHTDDNRLGYTLIRLGLLEPQELFAALREQQIARLIDLCGWPTGRYAFFDGQIFAGERFDLQLSALELIILAARRLPLAELEPRLAHLGALRPTWSPRRTVDLDQLKLTAFERRIANTIDGRRSVTELCAGLEGDHRRAALMVVYLLWETDAITLGAG